MIEFLITYQNRGIKIARVYMIRIIFYAVLGVCCDVDSFKLTART